MFRSRPAPPGDAYLAALDEGVVPLADACRPSWVIASPGFNAHRADPLTGLGLGGDCADIMARGRRLGRTGRRVVVREGGYDVEGATLPGTHRRPGGPPGGPSRPPRAGPGRAIVDALRRLRAEAGM